jgi:hypothetical protein
MHDFETHELSRGAHDVLRRELRLGQAVSYLISQQSESELDDPTPLFHSPKQTFVIATMLFNYRILDVAAWIQNVDSGPECGLLFQERRGRLPIKQLSRVVRIQSLELSLSC